MPEGKEIADDEEQAAPVLGSASQQQRDLGRALQPDRLPIAHRGRRPPTAEACSSGPAPLKSDSEDDCQIVGVISGTAAKANPACKTFPRKKRRKMQQGPTTATAPTSKAGMTEEAATEGAKALIHSASLREL